MSQIRPGQLNPTEQQALQELARRLTEQFDGLIHSLVLYGSKARGDSTVDSDMDVLVVVDSNDWRVHKQIHYITADIVLQYGLDLTSLVWSTAHHQETARLQTRLYRNIQRDGIDLLPLCAQP